jgi:hypothetical protein
MDADNEINRRDLMKTAGVASAAGAASALAGTDALAAEPLPPGFDAQPPLVENWGKALGDVADITVNLNKDAPELAEEPARERHRIYSYLLMKLIARFWNGNKRGPLGTYPLRVQQKDVAQTPPRYRGDTIPNPGGLRVNWDRYLGCPKSASSPEAASRRPAVDNWRSIPTASLHRGGHRRRSACRRQEN